MEAPECSGQKCAKQTYSMCRKCLEYVCGTCLMTHDCEATR